MLTAGPAPAPSPMLHFVSATGAACGAGPMRRIWEVDADALFIAMGVLLERTEIEAIFRAHADADRVGWRHDVLLREAVSRCAASTRFALVIERLLDRRTRSVRERVDGCSMSELAGFWLGAREHRCGRQLAALLWCLARDRRWLISGLFDRVRGDLWVRALRLLAEG